MVSEPTSPGLKITVLGRHAAAAVKKSPGVGSSAGSDTPRLRSRHIVAGLRTLSGDTFRNELRPAHQIVGREHRNMPRYPRFQGQRVPSNHPPQRIGHPLRRRAEMMLNRSHSTLHLEAFLHHGLEQPGGRKDHIRYSASESLNKCRRNASSDSLLRLLPRSTSSARSRKSSIISACTSGTSSLHHPALRGLCGRGKGLLGFVIKLPVDFRSEEVLDFLRDDVTVYRRFRSPGLNPDDRVFTPFQPVCGAYLRLVEFNVIVNALCAETS